MLQEIIDKVTAPGRNWLAKFQSLFYDATYGLFHDYRKKTLDLVRITAASLYLQGVRELRKAALVLFSVTLASVVFAVAVVVVPIAIVLVSPWAPVQKMIALAILGLTDISISLIFLSNLLSEENWMKMTKSQEMVEKIMKS